MKGKGKAKSRAEAKLKDKPWPIVTSDVCERCEVQCPAGIAYMEKMRTSQKAGRGVVCKKELYLRRKQQGLDPFRDIPALIKRNQGEQEACL